MNTETITNELNKLKEAFNKSSDREQLSILNSFIYMLAGKHNASLRQEVILILTGTKQPKSKVGIYAVENALLNWL